MTRAEAMIAEKPAMRRDYRGRFIKRLRETPADSREWLIWSKCHHCWHQRSETGGASGYTYDIAEAGIFIRAKASQYNDGSNNEPFHVSEVAHKIEAARDRLLAKLANIEFAHAHLASLAADMKGEG